eukprot:gene2093-2580_t
MAETISFNDNNNNNNNEDNYISGSSGSDYSDVDNPKNERKVRVKKTKKPKIIEEDIDEEKKSRLPSAEEVFNRIKWDCPEGIDANDFIVGYEDRFVGIMNVKFQKFEVGAIPLHRVRHISYNDRTIWDRKTRTYDFPTTSTIDNDNDANNNNNPIVA